MKSLKTTVIGNFLLGILVILSSIVFPGCEKDNNDNEIISSLNTTKVIVAGRVLNEWNLPIEYAEVTLGNTTALTDENGLYALNGVSIPVERGVMKISKSGYVTNYLGVSAEAGVQYLNVILPAAQTSTFNSSAGGTITATPSGSKLIFPPDAVVNEDGSPYTGQVLVYYDISDNTDSTYRLKFPGNDRMAINLQNAPKQFRTYSFGYIGLFTGSSVKLKLAPGKTATIQLPIPVSQLASAPATTVLCSFNEQTALWKEEMEATKNGNYYEATVNHFSFWGCGALYSSAYLKGRVLDCNNNPLSNIVVYFDYDNYEFTDNDGYFIKRVPANLTFDVNVPPANGLGVFSQMFTISPIGAGQLHNMGDIVLQCPAYLTGIMRDCNNTGVPAWVEVNYGSQYGFTGMYSTTGAFTVPVKSNMNVTMRYISPFKMVTSSATTPAQNLTTNLGNIAMCYTPDTANMITLNGAGYVNETFLLDVTQSSAQYRQSGKTYLSLNGTTLQGKSITLYAYVTGNSTGNYVCDAGLVNFTRLYVANNVNSTGALFTSEEAGASGNINIISYGNEIGRLKAYVSGTLKTSVANGLQSVSITGKMDLARVPNWISNAPSVLTANGDGFVNQTIQFDWCSMTSYFAGYVAGNYQSATNETVLKFAGCMNSSNGGFNGSLKFNGNGPGVYTAPADFYTTGFSIRKEFNGLTTKLYTEIVSGSLTINSYPPPGGYITGTFSGVFKRIDPVTGQAYTVNVTNASVSNWHFPDQ